MRVQWSLLAVCVAFICSGVHGAVVVPLSIDKSGVYELDFTCVGLVSVRSAEITIVNAAATKLFVAQSPGGVTVAGVPFAAQPIIVTQDASGNTVVNNTATVTAFLVGASAPLGVATGVGGTATFASTFLTIAAASNVLNFTSSPFSVLTTANFTIAHAPSHALLLERHPSNSVSQVPFAVQPSIAVRDEFGNLCTSDSTTVVTLALSSGPAATLAGSTAVTAVAGIVRWPTPA
jgi:hypothetical protein